MVKVKVMVKAMAKAMAKTVVNAKDTVMVEIPLESLNL